MQYPSQKIITQFEHHLKTGYDQLNIPVTDLQSDMMVRHAKELLLWNTKINLTAIKEPVAVAEKHFVDCLASVSLFKDGQRLMDMGSGGGFPGIPLKIMNPSLDVLLVDASRKKVNFLKHVIRLLGLEKINAIHARVEDLKKDDAYCNQFDCVISRAFSELDVFAGLAAPFLKSGGCIHAMKGRQAKEELNRADLAQFDIQTHTYVLPFEKSERFILSLHLKP